MCNCCAVTPSFLEMFAENELNMLFSSPSLRIVCLGGEPFPTSYSFKKMIVYNVVLRYLFIANVWPYRIL